VGPAGPGDIALDGSLGIDTVTVTAIADPVVVDSVGWGAQQHAEVPAGSPAQLNNVTITLVDADDESGILRLSPADTQVSLPSITPPSFPTP
jgi:hypothetical protein